jgi:hypothetical protein
MGNAIPTSKMQHNDPKQEEEKYNIQLNSEKHNTGILNVNQIPRRAH